MTVKIFDKTDTVQNGATGITEACIPFLPLPSNFQKRYLLYDLWTKEISWLQNKSAVWLHTPVMWQFAHKVHMKKKKVFVSENGLKILENLF